MYSNIMKSQMLTAAIVKHPQVRFLRQVALVSNDFTHTHTHSSPENRHKAHLHLHRGRLPLRKRPHLTLSPTLQSPMAHL